MAVTGLGAVIGVRRGRFPQVTYRILGLLVCVTLFGCATRVPQKAVDPFQVVPPRAWPDLADDLDRQGLEGAIEHALAFFESLPEEQVVAFGSVHRSAGELGEGFRRFRRLMDDHPDARSLTRALKKEFILLRSVGRDGRGEVLYTGYYEPVVEARQEPEPPFVHPVYGIPDDLVTLELEAFGLANSPRPIVGKVEAHELVPYAVRAEIDFGAGLTAPAPVLGYLSDLVDVFFLHVQGSGTLVFPDGSRVRAGYAVSNGREYRSIGRLLIDDGAIAREEMSMQAIRDYLSAHPEEIQRVLGHNPSYVFFRPLPSDGGPLGCYGVPVAAGRSIATDRRLLPAPVVAWIEGTMPGTDGEQRRFSRFAVNLDTGGSIKGPGRVDLFIGAGKEAAEIAGRMNNLGRLYLLLPSSI